MSAVSSCYFIRIDFLLFISFHRYLNNALIIIIKSRTAFKFTVVSFMPSGFLPYFTFHFVKFSLICGGLGKGKW